MVKNLHANAGDTGLIPELEDPLEKEMATHSRILAWETPWTEEPGYSPWGCKESDTIWLPNSKKDIRHTYMVQNNTLEE